MVKKIVTLQEHTHVLKEVNKSSSMHYIKNVEYKIPQDGKKLNAIL